MNGRYDARGLRRARCALLGAACMAAWLPLRAADTAPAPPPPEGANRAQIEQRIQAAQRRLEQAAREMSELSLALGEEGAAMGRRIATRMVTQRAMLGMAIDMREAGPNGEGVRVISVSPGGAAEAAGIRANDVVVSLDGKALRGEPDHSAQDQLLEISRAAKAGASLPIEYRRDGKVTKTQIVPKNVSDSFFNVRIPDLPGLVGPGGQPGEVVRFFGRGPGAFGATEMVELTPALGSYFGADKGLLVVRAPADARFKLQDGDVIQDIDGRVPGGVAHAFQILDSYRPGETVKLHIMRQKKRVELAVEIPQEGNPPASPERGGMQRGVPRAVPSPPTPPAGPTIPRTPERREAT